MSVRVQEGGSCYRYAEKRGGAQCHLLSVELEWEKEDMGVVIVAVLVVVVVVVVALLSLSVFERASPIAFELKHAAASPIAFELKHAAASPIAFELKHAAAPQDTCNIEKRDDAFGRREKDLGTKALDETAAVTALFDCFLDLRCLTHGGNLAQNPDGL